jgi:glycosyltransferase domain-containing protein
MNPILQRLTLVIPTYERQDFALRLMNYWADKGPHLIILDGSARTIAPAKLDVFGSHIQYLHRPVGIYQRLSESLDLIQTEYAALAGDDEFYIPTVVAACIKELDQDDGLIACCGRALGFRPKNQRVVGNPQYPRLEGYAVDAEGAEERVVQHMRDYVPSLVYAICSATQWKTAWKYTLQTEFPFFAAGELQFEMCMAYAGRSRVVPELMWLRSHGETEPVRGTDPSLDVNKRFPGWWADASKEKEHEEFISIMARGFNELLPDEGEDLRGAVIAGAEAYLGCYEKRKRGRIGLKTLRRRAVKMIPGFAKPFLKSVLRGLRRHESDQHAELLQAARVLEGSGVQVDFRELEEIERTIIQFHKNRELIGP